MKGRHLGALVTILGLVTVVACSGRETEAPAIAAKEEPAPVAAAPARPDTEQASAATEETQPDTAVKAASEAPEPEGVKDGPSPTPAEPAGPPPVPEKKAPAEPAASPAEAPAPATPVPAGRVEVGATKAGLTRIGADKCKLCHKTQYESWAATAHAAADPPLDCESCHGPGSEYKTMAIMKDPAKARAAGLVVPEASFCTSSCHDTGWSADMLTKAHAHKKG